MTDTRQSPPSKPEMSTSQVLLFSQPRTGCHLLERILTSKQDNARLLAHPAQLSVQPLSKWMKSDSFSDGMPEDVRVEYQEHIKQGNITWEQTLENTEKEGKILFMHTHPFFILSPDRLLASVTAPGTLRSDGRNTSLIPENLLLHPGTIPLFTIRHPLLLVPSSIRAIKKAETGTTRASFIIGTSLGFSREIYDWFVAHGVEPVVAEADDYMTSADFSQRLAQRLGLDPALVAVSWPKTTEDEQKLMHPVLLRIQETLVKSHGLDASRAARNVDLTEERARWREEFSEEEVVLIEELIAHVTPHYEYLRERRFVPSRLN